MKRRGGERRGGSTRPVSHAQRLSAATGHKEGDRYIRFFSSSLTNWMGGRAKLKPKPLPDCIIQTLLSSPLFLSRRIDLWLAHKLLTLAHWFGDWAIQLWIGTLPTTDTALLQIALGLHPWRFWHLQRIHRSNGVKAENRGVTLTAPNGTIISGELINVSWSLSC